MADGDALSPPRAVIYAAAYPSRYGIAWAIWRDERRGPPIHHGFVPGRGERFYAELCVSAYAAGACAELRWLDDESAAPFVDADGAS